MRRSTPIRDEDIFEVAMERFWDAPGGNDAGVRAVIEFCRNVFLDQADDHLCNEPTAKEPETHDRYECGANVHLIAAAPDLLALLKEAANFVQPFNRSQELLDRIDAAISKATAV